MTWAATTFRAWANCGRCCHDQPSLSCASRAAVPNWTPNSRPTAATTRIPCGRSIGLAHAYRAARRFDEALRWFELAAEGSARRRGPDHLETLRYQSSLANCHYAAGHTDVAIEMFAALFDARRAALGEEHPDTLRSRGSLANALHAVGRYDEAA